MVSFRSFLNDVFCDFSRIPMRENWTHDDLCLACGDGGELLLCNICPAAYHLKCIGAKKVQRCFSSIKTFTTLLCPCSFTRFFLLFEHEHPPPHHPLPTPTCLQVPVGMWRCPHHACCVCEKKSQDCSNCLFRWAPFCSCGLRI